jgi:hypothetical protein
MSSLFQWVIAASLFASGGHRALPQSFAAELAKQVHDKPLFTGPLGEFQDAALMTALAWTEGGNQPAVVGDCRGLRPGDPKCDHARATSFCVYQIHLESGEKTSEGWTGADLSSDPAKCITVARRTLRASITKGPADCPLCIYARGRDTPEARRLSNTRMGLAQKLLKEITATASEG